ncbi:SpoIIE family protein phosphatase [Streptomyces sp. NPDC096136]|uniref:SpoIIE family protein phosphatase n=1 Tax=Streptomyces sp. NPDC096136 TaxID=3366076 RepID=UPI0038266A26
MGSFDWDLVTGLMHLDTAALDVFDTPPEEYDGRPESLGRRVPAAEATRLDAMVSSALKSGSDSYGAYFRIRCRDGRMRWTHTQGRVMRDPDGRPYRIIGIVRDATEELSHSAERLGLDEERRRQTSVVESTTAALAHARTVKDVIDVIGDAHGLERLGSMGMVMGLVEAGRIHLVAEGPEGSFVPGTRYTRVDEQYPMSEVVRSLQPRFLESAEEFAEGYPALWSRISYMRISAAAYLPLIAQARPIGAIGLLYEDKDGFTQEERNLLVALGSSIAQSLQRAMLLEQEHDLAEGLQQAMLPRRIPAVPGAEIAVRYRSARMGQDIGGDWYDVIPLPGGRVGAVIGDVQGHDTHAAAVMGQLRIVLRAYAAEGHSPGTVMARASVFLHELDTDRFATCTYVEADLSTGVLQVVRAGHIDPLLRTRDGECRRLPVEGGMPLGLSAEFGRLEYPVTTVELDPGETLLLCTDGLVEQPGADLDDGVRVLTGLVREGPDDLQLLADRLCEVADERGGDDDMALLLLHREGDEAGEAGGGRLQQHVAPGDPEALVAARHMIGTAVRAWGARSRADEIELVADELIVNALMHTDGPAIVTLRALSGPQRRLRVEVEDRSSALPRRREAGEAGVSGRGLMLVDRLADVWGVEPRGGGKCVWCEFVVS